MAGKNEPKERGKKSETKRNINLRHSFRHLFFSPDRENDCHTTHTHKKAILWTKRNQKEEDDDTATMMMMMMMMTTICVLPASHIFSSLTLSLSLSLSFPPALLLCFVCISNCLLNRSMAFLLSSGSYPPVSFSVVVCVRKWSSWMRERKRKERPVIDLTGVRYLAIESSSLTYSSPFLSPAIHECLYMCVCRCVSMCMSDDGRRGEKERRNDAHKSWLILMCYPSSS